MFDEVPDQFHQFISSRTSLHIPIFHGSSPIFPSYDPYSSHHQTLQPHLLHEQSASNKYEEKEESSLLPTNLEFERERSIDPWSNEEVVELLRIRSSLENWFPDFTWEHVSRKLAELGLKRSAEKCREKFEEESMHLDSINYNKNYRFVSELEDIYHGENPLFSAGKKQSVEKPNDGDKNLEEDSRNEAVDMVKFNESNKKRKRNQKFEMLKGFCEAVVNKILDQQEELYNKILEDIVKKDDEKFAREEAWNKQEMDRINKEIELQEHEQVIAGNRQAIIIEFLKKFTSTSSEKPNSPTSISSSTIVVAQKNDPNQPDFKILAYQNPRTTLKVPRNPNSVSNECEEIGKRWPREEVLALINLRCGVNSNCENKEGEKIPLWERISRGMLELGYKRSAKRCKEKWENINKYFRKTKDSNKKRSLDSRTCPYFHQLIGLYNQGTFMAPNYVPENHSTSPENHSTSTPSVSSSGGANTHVAEGGSKNVIDQVPAFNYEF